MHNNYNLNDDDNIPDSLGTDDRPYASSVSDAPTWISTTPINVTTRDYRADQRNNIYPPPPPPIIRTSPARERMRKRRVNGRSGHGAEWAWVIIAGALFAIVIVISFTLFLLLRTSQQAIEVVPTAVVALPTPIDARTQFADLGIGDTLLMPDGSNIVIKPWDGQSRFTMVFMGLDRRPGDTGLMYRTDTIMLVSIEPSTRAIGILSIPRDLYVQIPGYAERQRVNTPMVYGESRQPGYGPRLMMETVQYNFGIRVNDYLAVDFQAFVDFVDLIGGIDINNETTISDYLYPDMNYGYDPFFLPAGLHHLDGVTALKYARTRHGDNDFERAKRQQQVLFAIRDRVLSLDMIPTLILQAPTLWNTVNKNVYTGLSLEQVIQLILYIKDIPQENIKTGVIDGVYIRPYTTSSGASVLIPNAARIGELMSEIFGPNYSQ